MFTGAGVGVLEGERDVAAVDRAEDRPGLRAIGDVVISQRATEAFAVLPERHAIRGGIATVNDVNRIGAIHVPPLELPPVAVELARAVSSPRSRVAESGPAAYYWRERRSVCRPGSRDEHGATAGPAQHANSIILTPNRIIVSSVGETLFLYRQIPP